MAREERSAIVIVSSGLGSRPIGGVTTYSAAKGCATYLAQALSYEVKDKIDVMSWEAGMSATNFIKGNEEMKKNLETPSKSVDGMLKDIGRERLTYGSFGHDWANWLFFAMPAPIVVPFMTNMFCDVYRKE